MGSDKPNGEDKPRAPTLSLQQKDGFVFSITQNEAADCSGFFDNADRAGSDHPMSLSHVYPIAPRESLHHPSQFNSLGVPETHCNVMPDFMTHNILPRHPREPNSMSLGGSLPEPLSVMENSSNKGQLSEILQSINCDRMVAADCVINSNNLVGCFQNSQFVRNFMPMNGHLAVTHQKIGQNDGEKWGNITTSRAQASFVSSGYTTPAFSNYQNKGALGMGHNANFGEDQLSPLQKADGGFLTLGIGGNSEVRPTLNFGSREIVRKMAETMPTQQNAVQVSQTNQKHLSLDHNFAGNFSNIADSGQFSSPVWNMGGRNASGSIHGANAAPHSSARPIIPAAPQILGHTLSKPSISRSGFVGRKGTGFSNSDLYKGFCGDQVASSAPCTSSFVGSSYSRQTRSSGPALESANSIQMVTEQPLDQRQQAYMKAARNFFTESSTKCLLPTPQGSSTRKNQSGGQLLSALEGTAARVNESSLLTQQKVISVAENNAAHAVSGSQLPNRLGVDFNERVAAQAAEGGPFFNWTSVPMSRSTYRAQHGGPNQYPTTHLRRPVVGHPQYNLPLQFNKDLPRPASAGQVIPVAPVIGHAQPLNVNYQPPLKRTAIQPPAAPLAQRRKITSQPITHPSMLRPPQRAVPSIPIPYVPSHIKWQGADGPLQSSGKKCLLCKRDLSFTPEGPVFHPAIPPPVAVLPCGHFFHDHCLQIITPAEESKNPPCIPCAIGET